MQSFDVFCALYLICVYPVNVTDFLISELDSNENP